MSVFDCKSLQVSYFIESGQELVPPGVSDYSKGTSLYLAKGGSDGIISSFFEGLQRGKGERR